jgi:hypothetical protein
VRQVGETRRRQTGGETATSTTRSEKKIGETGWRREDENGEEVVIGYDAGGERTRTRWGLETGERRKKNHCYYYHCDLMY